ncbi:MAG: hypothetical protein ACJAU1_001878 [Psychromonas sp.]|jgi:hypothetical protein
MGINQCIYSVTSCNYPGVEVRYLDDLQHLLFLGDDDFVEKYHSLQEQK